MGAVRIGTSGWVYAHWRDRFYPRSVRQRDYLDYYARHFDTVEVNYSFYRLPTRENFERWASRTPANFTFAVKASRFLTHVKRLRDPEPALHRLVERAAGLGGKLGPILYQFPPDWRKDIARLQAFLAVLPGSHRHAFEFRHASWLDDEVCQALADHGCALCIPNAPGMPFRRVITAPFTYLRFHHGAHGASYADDELRPWATWVVEEAHQGIDVFAYFNNDVEAYAIANAQSFRRLTHADR